MLRFRSTRALPLGVAAASLAVLASACSSTSASGSGGGGGGSLNLVAYSTPQKVYEALIPQFNATADGKGVSFKQSYGASGRQNRAAPPGRPAPGAPPPPPVHARRCRGGLPRAGHDQARRRRPRRVRLEVRPVQGHR